MVKFIVSFYMTVFKQEKCQKDKGFSLLEIVLALAILSVLMVVTVNVVKNEREYDHLLVNQQYMTNVKEALITFVKVNGFLPCPDSDGDGVENRVGMACDDEDGTIPFLDLGVPETDAWDQPLSYSVNARADNEGTLGINVVGDSARYFNNQSAPLPVFQFETLPMGQDRPGAGNYNICGEQTSPTVLNCNGISAPTLIENAAIAVVVSFGQNGAATWAEINSGSSANLDRAEAENADRDQNFWLASGSQREGQAFDDQLFWITGWDVKYAIISSGGAL